MASQSLLSAAGNGTGSGATVTDEATVHISNASVFDGGRVLVETSVADTAANYAVAYYEDGNPVMFSRAGAVTLGIKGAYYVRCKVEGGGASVAITATLDQ